MKEDKGSYTGDEGAARALAGIGETYIKQDDLDKASKYLRQAIDSFKKFLEVAPDDPQASIIEGLIPKLEEMIKK